MKDQKWIRKEYETWDGAFRALAPIIRQQSVRVAAYTQVLFVQACASSWGKKTPMGAEQMHGRYAELAYKCGMYHQLGKALVPTEYQIFQKDFTEEEVAVYQKYTTDGRQLVARLQEQTLRNKAKRTGNEELATENITWMMIRESCQQHMERYDGTGYPDGRSGNEISPIAHIVGLAKELDRLASETKSEAPFAEAFNALCAMSGTAFDPELIKVLEKAHAKCYEVYQKYINYTLTIPQTIPLVDKSRNRPMGLKYSPMIDALEDKTTAYEAIPWFGGLRDEPDVLETISEVEAQLSRLDMVPDMSFYFMYEATDAILRIQNCKLGLDAIVLQMIPSFYTTGSQLQRFIKLFEDQPVEKSRLILTIPQSVLLEANKETVTVLNRYIRNGIQLMIDDWQPEQLSAQEVKALGIEYVRPDPELYLKKEVADVLTALPQQGITVYAKGVDDDNALRWLAACGVKHMRGTITGVAVTEDEMIRDEILRERRHG